MLSFQATLTPSKKKLPPHVHLKMSLNLPVKVIRWIAHQMVLCQNLQIQPKTHSEQPAENKNWCYYKTIRKHANSQSSIEILPSPHIVDHLFYFGMSENIVNFLKIQSRTGSISLFVLYIFMHELSTKKTNLGKWSRLPSKFTRSLWTNITSQ